jgi:hypothetical protein
MLAWIAQTYTTTTTSSSVNGGLIAGIFVAAIVFYLLFAFALLGVFKKAGQPSWAAFVPIANGWFLYEAAGNPGWWVLVGLIPFCGGIIAFVLWIIVAVNLSKSFGKGGGFAVGLIFLSIIFLYILGYGSAQYLGPAGRKNSMPVPPMPPQMPPPGYAQPQ